MLFFIFSYCCRRRFRWQLQQTLIILETTKNIHHFSGDLTSNVLDTGIGELHTKRVAKQLASALDFLHSKYPKNWFFEMKIRTFLKFILEINFLQRNCTSGC